MTDDHDRLIRVELSAREWWLVQEALDSPFYEVEHASLGNVSPIN